MQVWQTCVGGNECMHTFTDYICSTPHSYAWCRGLLTCPGDISTGHTEPSVAAIGGSGLELGECGHLGKCNESIGRRCEVWASDCCNEHNFVVNINLSCCENKALIITNYKLTRANWSALIPSTADTEPISSAVSALCAFKEESLITWVCCHGIVLIGWDVTVHYASIVDGWQHVTEYDCGEDQTKQPVNHK